MPYIVDESPIVDVFKKCAIGSRLPLTCSPLDGQRPKTTQSVKQLKDLHLQGSAYHPSIVITAIPSCKRQYRKVAHSCQCANSVRGCCSNAPPLGRDCLAFSLLLIQLLNTAVPADLLRRWVNRWLHRLPKCIEARGLIVQS